MQMTLIVLIHSIKKKDYAGLHSANRAASYFATLSLLTVSRLTFTSVIYVNKITEIALSPVAHLTHSNRKQ